MIVPVWLVWVKPDLTESMPGDLPKAPVSFKVTGVSGGTGNPYSRGKARFTAKCGELDGVMPDARRFF